MWPPFSSTETQFRRLFDNLDDFKPWKSKIGFYSRNLKVLIKRWRRKILKPQTSPSTSKTTTWNGANFESNLELGSCKTDIIRKDNSELSFFNFILKKELVIFWSNIFSKKTIKIFPRQLKFIWTGLKLIFYYAILKRLYLLITMY